MSRNDQMLKTLREAANLSPENFPLRHQLARTLAQAGELDEAEETYLQALALKPHDAAVKLELAHVYFRNKKHSAAAVIVEELFKIGQAPVATHLLYAHLLLHEGDTARALRAYQRALDLDPSLADAQLAAKLGIPQARPRSAAAQPMAQQREPEDDDDDDDLDERMRVPAEDLPAPLNMELERPEVDFSDVGGMEALKEEIRLKIIHPLTHPEIYKAYGKTAGGGILLYGPPGCGKTFLARATAGEVKANFLSVGLSDVLDMWLGSSEQRLHEIFQQARENAPCVLFFDEVDALGASRADMRQSAARHLINQFLAELDGVKHSNEGVLVLAATNAPWHLDSAFRRPGRFDRVLFVPPPDLEARAEILQIMLRDKPVGAIDLKALAKKTADFSGADLKGVIDTAVEAKMTEAFKTGKPVPLTGKDLLGAAARLRPTTREWFSTARNYALYANQSGLYDEILQYLKIK